MKENRLAIFNRFKTGGANLTGEAKRQRSIITALELGTIPTDRTRTGIAQQIASTEKTVWKNIYSGIFKDLDEILLPMQIVREDGRLPLKRGPKALQEIGVPYYSLTKSGMIIAASLVKPDKVKHLLDAFAKEADDNEEYAEILCKLSGVNPVLVSYVMRRYAEMFCAGVIEDLLPLDLLRLREMQDETFAILKESLESFSEMQEPERDDMTSLLDKVTADIEAKDDEEEDGDDEE